MWLRLAQFWYVDKPEVFDIARTGGRVLFLNRPKAMNALTLPMVRRMTEYLMVRAHDTCKRCGGHLRSHPAVRALYLGL